MTLYRGKEMGERPKAVAFDLDAASLTSIREALSDWEIEVVKGATPASLTRDWNPGTVDLLVVSVGAVVADTLALCRFLCECDVISRHCGNDSENTLGPRGSLQTHAQRAHAPLLVLAAPGQEGLVREALDAGAHSCLLLPINAKDVASMLLRARAGNQPGRHTLNLEGAQSEDSWRDDGGQG
jgi:DNA-binding NarL/FixJ family response regulator